MMQMIPLYNVFLNRKHSDTSYYDPILFEEIEAHKDMEMDQLRSPSDYEEDYLDTKSYSLLAKSVDPNVILNDCKLSGCDAACKKNHPNKLIGGLDVDCKFVAPSDLNDCLLSVQPYTPDNDHSYYTPASKVTFQPTFMTDTDNKLDILMNIPTPPLTESPSSSEDEVDVVTVPEEYQPPVVQRYDYLPRRSARTPKLVQKPQRTQRQQVTLTAKSLKAAMKRTSIKPARRTYRRRKLTNSVETTPSSSPTSSAHNSRCNSDNENPNPEKSKKENSNSEKSKDKSKKKKVHNDSEKARREVQRTALQGLRVCIPELQMTPKAPKVLILNSATSLIRKLEQNAQTLEDIKYREMQRKSDLKNRLYQLRMSLKQMKQNNMY